MIYFGVGSVLLLASALSFYDGDGPPFLAGLLTFCVGAPLFISAPILSMLATRRMPRFVTEARTCDIDDEGIRVRGSTWAEVCAWEAFRSASVRRHLILLHRERGVPSFVLPRSAFTGPPEATLVRILRERGLLP